MKPSLSLPPVRGRLTRNAPIGKQTWFGVGGPAEVLFRPADYHRSLVFYRDGVLVQALVVDERADLESADRFLSSVASRH